MAWELSSPNTGTSAATQLTPHEMWKRGVDIFEQTKDFFQQFEGNSPSSPIRTITDTSKGRGHKITFTSMAGLYNEPKHAEQLFEASTDFEKLKFDEDSLELDVLRHAVRWTERMEEHMGMRGEIVSGLPAEMGKWLGRTKCERMAMMYINKGAAGNTIVAGDGASVDDLTSADTLSWDEVVKMGVHLERLGGRPAEMKTVNGNMVECRIVASVTDALYALELDDNYKQLLRDAGTRGDTNFMFKGGYSFVRGHTIHKWNPIDHDGDGAVASPFNPKAYLNAQSLSGIADATFNIDGGGSSATLPGATGVRDYFKFFPKYAYKFNERDVVSPGSNDFYVLIYNPPTAAIDPNKFGFAKINGNDGDQLSVLEKLSATAGTVKKNTVGSVTYNAAPWTDVFTENWDADAVVMLANAKGQPYGYTLMMGAESARRGYGKYRNKRGEESHEDDYVKDIFVRTYFGQQPRMDAAGRFPGYTLLQHSINYAGVPVPTVT